MKQYRTYVLRSAIAGVLAVAGSYAVSGWSVYFVGSAVNKLLITITPGPVIAVTLRTLGTAGELVAFVGAILLAVLFFSIAAFLGFERAVNGPENAYGVFIGGFLGGTVSTLIAYSLVKRVLPALVMGFVVGAYILVTQFDRDLSTDVDRADRRTLLSEIAFVIGFGGVSYLFGQQVTHGPSPEEITPVFSEDGAGSKTEQVAEAEELLEAAEEKSLDVRGMPGLVSSIEDFYEVDINRINPDVVLDNWALSVTGAVEKPLTVTYDDLRQGPVEHRFVTLRCVGDPLNGHKMDNALWTGIPVSALLSRADPQGDYVMLRSVDNYYEEFSMAALKKGFLAFGMNGKTLPRSHGYPVRALIPGHWGEINVKWIDEIEILDEPATGYWEKKGWHGTGPVNTVAKLWTINHLPDGRIEVGGHAYAGTRGIQSVQVSTNAGRTWDQATLGPALDAEDAWRQWVYRFVPTQERMQVTVRAVDGTGRMQAREEDDPFPRGASGWVDVTVFQRDS
ncbi:MAG: molybdopterin-dependent oxidoreductase [Halodesulfurarchaeum sp.]